MSQFGAMDNKLSFRCFALVLKKCIYQFCKPEIVVRKMNSNAKFFYLERRTQARTNRRPESIIRESDFFLTETVPENLDVWQPYSRHTKDFRHCTHILRNCLGYMKKWTEENFHD